MFIVDVKSRDGIYKGGFVRNSILSCLIFCFMLSAFAMAGDSDFETNTVYFEKVTAKPGEHFAVKVYLANVDDLAGCQVPIFYRHEKINLWCDSISFKDSRMEYFSFNDIKLPQTEDADKVAFFAYIASIDPDVYTDPLSKGDGLLATLYFTAPKDCPEGKVELKRGMIPHPHVSYVYSLWDASGNEVDSDFQESTITIKK